MEIIYYSRNRYELISYTISQSIHPSVPHAVLYIFDTQRYQEQKKEWFCLFLFLSPFSLCNNILFHYGKKAKNICEKMDKGISRIYSRRHKSQIFRQCHYCEEEEEKVGKKVENGTFLKNSFVVDANIFYSVPKNWKIPDFPYTTPPPHTYLFKNVKRCFIYEPKWGSRFSSF